MTAKSPRGTGRLYLRGGVYWHRLRVNGIEKCQSTRCKTLKDAEFWLKTRPQYGTQLTTLEVVALNEWMKQHKLGCVKAARIVGCTPMTIQRWRKGGSIHGAQRRLLLFVLSPKQHINLGADGGSALNADIEVKLRALLVKATARSKKNGVDLGEVWFGADMMHILAAIGNEIGNSDQSLEAKNEHAQMIEQASNEAKNNAFKTELKLDKARKMGLSQEEIKAEECEPLCDYIARNSSDIIAAIRFIQQAYIPYFRDIQGDMDDEQKITAIVLAAAGFRSPNKLIEHYLTKCNSCPPENDPPCPQQVLDAVAYLASRRTKKHYTIGVVPHRRDEDLPAAQKERPTVIGSFRDGVSCAQTPSHTSPHKKRAARL